ncbi:leucine rich repeat-containing protein [Toxoplasma gondii ME49]|uniref:Leucine rich repeat protein, putative n=2 Tax=Toxoplasma gondii TaxID=5811 RepID=B6KGG1_TOXGV|nr:leucine rich repeat-containing protein [Toxoplasma gondii ME49]EPT30807.1 leucine rich repeat-containing protein [Toxoplasma gondii ME49]ESS31313.1 leucine rich repeat-containing protein [Toxoplasma gondii VEG]CEL73292.1 TPA: leucine rich repeat protein, putative [Toxoplasma gondii VEG]|eukprot:XP_002366561.1 leucine rich repeat-containing protein [Toxoplasma gondii ME49]
MRITEQLLRQRSEHNDGILSELEEVALHQFEIEKIENVDKLCKHLKILLLQNNIIEKIENVQRLKELEYLNLALNNITRIENLGGCESLKKLDLTVNFIDVTDLEESVLNLKDNEKLEDLYLMGNPCTEWDGWRLFVVASLPQLRQLDGKLITPSERIEAARRLSSLKSQLKEKIKEKQARPQSETSSTAYTTENRKKMYLEMARVSLTPASGRGYVLTSNGDHVHRRRNCRVEMKYMTIV